MSNSNLIDISQMDKAEVLAKLYNASQPLGMGFIKYDPKPMTREEAQSILEKVDSPYFDYLKGRVMKINLSGDQLDPRLYDRDNGEGQAAYALTVDLPVMEREKQLEKLCEEAFAAIGCWMLATTPEVPLSNINGHKAAYDRFNTWCNNAESCGIKFEEPSKLPSHIEMKNGFGLQFFKTGQIAESCEQKFDDKE